MKTKLGILGVLAALFAVGGCKKAETTSSSSTGGGSEQATRTVTLLSWDEYFDPEALEGFTAETGIELNYETFEDFDEFEAMLNSRPGDFDVVVADDSSLERFIELRLVRPLESDKIPNISNISDAYLDRSFDRGNKYSVPYTWGTTLVAYRADKIAEPQMSWEILSNPEYRGKVMILGDRTEALGIGLMSQGFEINSADKAELDSAADSIVNQIESLGVRFGSDVETKEAIDSGDAWVAVCYSGDAALVASENENVGFFIPEEGAPLWIDNFALANASAKGDEAHSLINYLLRADVAAANANFTWYATPNEAAMELVSEDLRTDETIHPPKEVADLCKLFEKPDSHREKMLNAAWRRVQEAMQKQEQLATLPGEEPGSGE